MIVTFLLMFAVVFLMIKAFSGYFGPSSPTSPAFRVDVGWLGLALWCLAEVLLRVWPASGRG